MVTAKKVLGKKFPEKVLKFHTKKVLWKKVLFLKKSPEIKSFQFETLFSMTFFLAPLWFYTKKSSEKKSSKKWKCKIHNSRFFFSSDLFSSGLFFLRFYFLRLYWQPPYYFRKKSPKNPKHWTLFPVTWENSDFFSNVFKGFFQKLFFPGTFLHRFIYIYTLLICLYS